MPLKIHNSLTRSLEVFEPLVPGEVKMYVCGPTVYDEPHVGHLRSAYVFDVIRRYLEHSGSKVKFVRNVTDVDDKIIDKARESGSELVGETKKISEKYYELYSNDLAALGVAAPTLEPRATEFIEAMKEMIGLLIQKGAAYENGGDVYFSVASRADYGKLSGQKRDAMMEGTRIDPNEKKRDPLDFALWKKAKEGEPAWDSPWGKGRPGWHMECSAMNRKCLGEQIDIHGGGRDLIFPHHENEIAQSEAATGKAFSKYWIHHGLITVNGQKMSKSLKNYVTLDQVRQDSPWGIEELKFLFLGTHYSMPLDYSAQKMRMQKSVRERFVFFLEELKALRGKPGLEAEDFERQFQEAMDEDFNTPQALAVMHEMVSAARKGNDALKIAAADKLRSFASLLGLRLEEEAPADVKIEALIRERELAKKVMDYKKADQIRERLLHDQGVTLFDTPTGTKWRKA